MILLLAKYCNFVCTFKLIRQFNIWLLASVKFEGHNLQLQLSVLFPSNTIENIYTFMSSLKFFFVVCWANPLIGNSCNRQSILGTGTVVYFGRGVGAFDNILYQLSQERVFLFILPYSVNVVPNRYTFTK